MTNPIADSTVLDRLINVRKPFAWGILVVAVTLLSISVYSFTTMTVRSEEKTPEATSTTKTQVEGDKSESKESYILRDDRLLSGIWTGLLGIVVALGGLTLLMREPSTTRKDNLDFARLWLLVVGGLVGLLSVLYGLSLAYLWRRDLLDWIQENKTDNAWWVLLSLAMILFGLTTTFLALMPARSEERHNVVLRRVVYGYSVAMNAVLLVIVLVIGNVVVHLKLPNKLDVTEAKFYTLDDATKRLLSELQQQTKAYVLLPQSDRPPYRDIRPLLNSMAEVNPKFKVVLLPPGSSQSDILALVERFPQIERTAQGNIPMGILLTYGDQEEKARFLRATDLVGQNLDNERNPVQTLQAESRIITELSFMMEGEVKPVIYFTRGFGEALITDRNDQGGSADLSPRDTALVLRDLLVRRNFEVKSLDLTQVTSVPTDAAVVVVGGPEQTFRENAAKILRDYLAPPKESGRTPGRLLLLSGWMLTRDGRMMNSGLEDLLSSFNVSLESEFLYTQDPQLPSLMRIAAASEGLRATNELAKSMSNRDLRWLQCRTVRTLPVLANSPMRPTTIFATNPRFPTWITRQPESLISAAQRAILLEEKNPEILQIMKSFNYGLDEKPVGVAVTDDQNVPRVVVYGCGVMHRDMYVQRLEGGNSNLELIAATLDYLRGRPQNIGIKEHEYKVFRLDPKVDQWRLLIVPLILTIAGVCGLGIGVWVVRRR